MGHPIGNRPKAIPSFVEGRLKNGQAFKVRRLSEEDYGVLAPIFVEAYLDREDWWTEELAKKRLGGLVDTYRHVVGLVIEVGNVVVGATLCHQEYGMTEYTYVGDELFLQPGYGENGAGSALMLESLHRGSVWFDAESFIITTFRMEPHPKEFYRRIGLEELGDDGMVKMKGPVREIIDSLTLRNGGERLRV
jgi:hypothetical protein